MKHLAAYIVGLVALGVGGYLLITHPDCGVHNVLPWGVGTMAGGALVLAPASTTAAGQAMVSIFKAFRGGGGT